jgi:hypothetical protein
MLCGWLRLVEDMQFTSDVLDQDIFIAGQS